MQNRHIRRGKEKRHTLYSSCYIYKSVPEHYVKIIPPSYVYEIYQILFESQRRIGWKDRDRTMPRRRRCWGVRFRAIRRRFDPLGRSANRFQHRSVFKPAPTKRSGTAALRELEYALKPPKCHSSINETVCNPSYVGAHPRSRAVRFQPEWGKNASVSALEPSAYT